MEPATHLLSIEQWNVLCDVIRDSDLFDPPTWHITFGRVKIRPNEGPLLETILADILGNGAVIESLRAVLDEIAITGYFKKRKYIHLAFEETCYQRLKDLKLQINHALTPEIRRLFEWDVPHTTIARTDTAVQNVTFPEANRISVSSEPAAFDLRQILCFQIGGFMKQKAGPTSWESYRSLSLHM